MVDKAGIPLPGVSVVIKGTTLGVPTDIDGKFVVICGAVECGICVFFRGNEKQEISVTDDKEFIGCTGRG